MNAQHLDANLWRTEWQAAIFKPATLPQLPEATKATLAFGPACTDLRSAVLALQVVPQALHLRPPLLLRHRKKKAQLPMGTCGLQPAAVHHAALYSQFKPRVLPAPPPAIIPAETVNIHQQQNGDAPRSQTRSQLCRRSPGSTTPADKPGGSQAAVALCALAAHDTDRRLLQRLILRALQPRAGKTPSRPPFAAAPRSSLQRALTSTTQAVQARMPFWGSTCR